MIYIFLQMYLFVYKSYTDKMDESHASRLSFMYNMVDSPISWIYANKNLDVLKCLKLVYNVWYRYAEFDTVI